MSTIRLFDVDGHNFPNLALMKLSAYHRSVGDYVNPPGVTHYDRVYASKVFTHTPDSVFIPSGDEVLKGGTGYSMTAMLDDEVEHMCPDYSLYGVEHAYGFLTRGCPNRCPWCFVPAKEGAVRPGSPIEEFLDGRSSAVLMDNNVLASPFGLNQLERIVDLGVAVDFNQGLDARVIADSPEIASLLGRVKWLRPLRMACDTAGQMEAVGRSVAMLRAAGAVPRQYFVYVLVRDDLEDAMARVAFLRSIGCDPFAQPLIGPSGEAPPARLKRFARWVNCRQLRNVPWEDYRYGAHYPH
jgi:hypothetical protein